MFTCSCINRDLPMCRYGPLVQSWCMRFEGKHNYFKDLAHRVKCFKNIPKTLARRHQRLVCYNLAASHSSIFKETMFGPGKLYRNRKIVKLLSSLSFFTVVTTSDVSSLEYEEYYTLLFPGSS